jgi:hypothetical protein
MGSAAVPRNVVSCASRCRNRATGDIVAIKKFRGNYDDPNLRRGMQREVKVRPLPVLPAKCAEKGRQPLM